jgi:hemoglobin
MYLAEMKRDIGSREDVERLIDAFYEKVRRDDMIGYFFNEVAKVDWPHHLPIMYDFWESILFYKAAYKGNPMQVHTELNGKSPMRKEHFERWRELFLETIAEQFEGEKAELARQRAQSVSTMIQLKIASIN